MDQQLIDKLHALQGQLDKEREWSGQGGLGNSDDTNAMLNECIRLASKPEGSENQVEQSTFDDGLGHMDPEHLRRTKEMMLFRRKHMPPIDETMSIHDILIYWQKRGVMLELLGDAWGGAWRAYAKNFDGTDHEGDGDLGCDGDPTHIARIAHKCLLFAEIVQVARRIGALSPIWEEKEVEPKKPDDNARDIWSYFRDVAAWFVCAERKDGPIKMRFDEWLRSAEADATCGDSIRAIDEFMRPSVDDAKDRSTSMGKAMDVAKEKIGFIRESLYDISHSHPEIGVAMSNLDRLETTMASILSIEKSQMAVLRRLLRSLDVQHCANDFPEAAQEARDLLLSQGIGISHADDQALIDRAETLGIALYTEAQRYGDGHPKGCFIMALDVDKAKLIESAFALETGNAPDDYDIAAIEASEDKNDMSVWVDYDDEEMFIEIKAEDEGFTMIFGEGRLKQMVELFERDHGNSVSQHSAAHIRTTDPS